MQMVSETLIQQYAYSIAIVKAAILYSNKSNVLTIFNLVIDTSTLST